MFYFILFIFVAGAFGYFEVTHDITRYCKAKVFEHVGKTTPIAVRFSTVGKDNHVILSQVLKCCHYLKFYLKM